MIHFGIIPRTNRGLFCLNELPDLQPRIQVGLLNILEARDLQIRGFPLRLKLDILTLFTANPEDYTNRGNIITPLKDRIASQIITHYPQTMKHAVQITAQEANVERANLNKVAGLQELVDKYHPVGSEEEAAAIKELILEGFHQHSVLSREGMNGAVRYGDMLSHMISDL